MKNKFFWAKAGDMVDEKRQQLYASLSPEDKQRVMDKIDELLLKRLRRAEFLAQVVKQYEA